jgi:hypothetical protein
MGQLAWLKPLVLNKLQQFGGIAKIFAKLLVGGIGWPRLGRPASSRHSGWRWPESTETGPPSVQHPAVRVSGREAFVLIIFDGVTPAIGERRRNHPNPPGPVGHTETARRPRYTNPDIGIGTGQGRSRAGPENKIRGRLGTFTPEGLWGADGDQGSRHQRAELATRKDDASCKE